MLINILNRSYLCSKLTDNQFHQVVNTMLRSNKEKLQERLEAAHSKNKELAKKLGDKEKELKETLASLSRWDLWWAWVSAKASPALLRLLGRLGRKPPRPLGDRGWGGGR